MCSITISSTYKMFRKHCLRYVVVITCEIGRSNLSVNVWILLPLTPEQRVFPFQHLFRAKLFILGLYEKKYRLLISDLPAIHREKCSSSTNLIWYICDCGKFRISHEYFINIISGYLIFIRLIHTMYIVQCDTRGAMWYNKQTEGGRNDQLRSMKRLWVRPLILRCCSHNPSIFRFSRVHV